MAIRVKCPNPKCGKEFNLKAELAGKTVRCDACKQPFQVPSPLGPQRSQALSVVSSGAAPQARSPTGAATQAESPTGAPATGPVSGP
jgi:hypothetical protein